MKIIAIDLGTTTGYAIGDARSDALCKHGTKNFKPLKQECEGMRYLKFYSWMVGLIKEHQPDKVYFEQFVGRHSSTNSAHIYGGLRGQLLLIMAGFKIPVEGLSVPKIKKHATGKGNADKTAMIEAAEALGYAPNSSDDADAIHIFNLAKELLNTKQEA